MTKRNFQKMEYDAEHRQENNNGLRTEKIMLEITHCCMYPVAEWVLELIQDTCTDPGESVRVVPEWDQIRESCDRVSREALTEEVEALNKEINRLTDERDAAIRVAELEAARGWLTAEEREHLQYFADGYRAVFRTREVVRKILARSTPPEVVLPGEPNRFRYGDDAIANRDRQWLAALAAAGVNVKEASND